MKADAYKKTDILVSFCSYMGKLPLKMTISMLALCYVKLSARCICIQSKLGLLQCCLALEGWDVLRSLEVLSGFTLIWLMNSGICEAFLASSPPRACRLNRQLGGLDPISTN